mgnify:CR=1 FL=1
MKKGVLPSTPQIIMAGAVGFEPTMRESESRALPLGDAPLLCLQV